MDKIMDVIILKFVRSDSYKGHTCSSLRTCLLLKKCLALNVLSAWSLLLYKDHSDDGPSLVKWWV